jgi:hypothetical protein
MLSPALPKDWNQDTNLMMHERFIKVKYLDYIVVVE